MAEITADGVVARPVQFYAAELQGELSRALNLSDLNFDIETPQGQLVNLLALRDARIDQELVDVFNAGALNTAQGAQLDGLLQIFRVFRRPASSSTAVVRFTGAAGTSVPASTQLRSVDGDLFATASVGTIAAGESSVDIAVEALETGPTGVVAGSIDELVTGVPGISSVTNPTDGVIGRGVETDAQFRNRYIMTAAINSLGSIDAVRAAVIAVEGVTSCVVRDNPTATAITVGVTQIAPYSMLVIVEGGDTSAIGAAILGRKPAGTPTVGAIEAQVSIATGVTETVRFTRVTPTPITATLQIATTAEYPASNSEAIRNALVEFVGRLRPGESLDTDRAQAEVLRFDHFDINSLSFAVKASGAALPTTVDITNRLTLALVDATLSIT